MVSRRDILLLYGREMKSALRDRTVVVNSILLPIFLYPVMLWLVFTGMTFVQGKTEGFVSRVALLALPEGHASLKSKLEKDDRFKLETESDNREEARKAVQAGDLDAAALFLPPKDAGRALTKNFRVEVVYDQSKERSAQAKKRLDDFLGEYRDQMLEQEAQARGLTETDWMQYRVERFDAATQREVGRFILGLIVPMVMSLMVAIGCFYPAVDATAGERERSTWETLMSLGTSRANIVAAKYLYVATMGTVAGLLNLAALAFSMSSMLAPLLKGESSQIEFKIPLAALPVMVAGAVLLGLFLAAGMMICASFARTFKEGQAMVTPFYLLSVVPVVFMQAPGLKFNLILALIPVVNVVMMFREAITGTYSWPLIAVTVVVELLVIVLCLRLAVFILGFEDFLLGTGEGSLVKFLKAKWGRRAVPRGAAP